MPYLLAISPAEGVEFDVSIRHDWRVGVGNWNFGLTEFIAADDELDGHTTIHVGPTYLQTNFSAFEVLAASIVSAVLLIAAISFVIARYGRRQGPAP